MQFASLKIPAAFLLGVLLAGGISFAFAQSAGMPVTSQPGFTAQGALARNFAGRFNWNRRRMQPGPVGAVIADLNGIQRLYLMSGQRKNVADLYQYLLSKTQNPMLRNYAYRRLARAQVQVTDTGQAIATLRKSLDENLARVNQLPAKS